MHKKYTVICHFQTKNSKIFSADYIVHAAVISSSHASAHVFSAVSSDPTCTFSTWDHAYECTPQQFCMSLPLSVRLLPALPTSTSSLLAVWLCHQDPCPGVHFMSASMIGYFTTCSRHRRSSVWQHLILLWQLQWLPVHQWVRFKVMRFMQQSLARVTPVHTLSEVGGIPFGRVPRTVAC